MLKEGTDLLSHLKERQSFLHGKSCCIRKKKKKNHKKNHKLHSRYTFTGREVSAVLHRGPVFLDGGQRDTFTSELFIVGRGEQKQTGTSWSVSQRETHRNISCDMWNFGRQRWNSVFISLSCRIELDLIFMFGQSPAEIRWKPKC